MVPVGTQRVEGLAEADFDLEARPIELNRLEGGEGEHRGHNDQLPSGRVFDEYEPDQASDRAPHQIFDEVPDLDAGLAVDGAERRDEGAFP